MVVGDAQPPERLLARAAHVVRSATADIGPDVIADLRSRIDEKPKGTRWKVRARVGERVKWYEEPEEVG